MTGSVRVTNIRVDLAPYSEPDEEEEVFRIDRSNPVLGNKHILRNKLDRQERAAVIQRHFNDLQADILAEGPMFKALLALAHKIHGGRSICLACHCSPLPCHGDNYVPVIMRMAALLKKCEETNNL